MAENELTKIVGSNNVFSNAEVLEDYAKDSSFVTHIRPRCIVKPQNAEEVQEIVKWANKTLTFCLPSRSFIDA